MSSDSSAYYSHFDEVTIKRLIILTLHQFIPVLMFGGNAESSISTFLANNNLCPVDVISLQEIRRYIKNNSGAIATFIHNRLSIVSIFTIERVLRGHRLSDNTLCQLTWSITTCFFAFSLDTQVTGKLAHLMPAYARIAAELIDFERRNNRSHFRLNHSHFPLVDDSDGLLQYTPLPCMVHWLHRRARLTDRENDHVNLP